MNIFTRAVAGTLALSVAFSAQASAAPTAQKRARVAVRYLVSQQETDGSIPAFSAIGSTADAIVSMVAARRAPKAIQRAFDYLVSQEAEVDSIGEKAKVVLAMDAAQRDPRDFAGRDLVQEIRSTMQQDGRFGAETPVIEHALAMIALYAAGSPAPNPAAQWLVEAQCADGGWPFQDPAAQTDDEHCSSGPQDFDRSNNDTTSYAVQALAVTPGPATAEHDSFGYFTATRDTERKGWGYDASFRTTNSNSTALVIQAYVISGRNLPAGAYRALTKLQYRLCGENAGAFAFTWEDEDGDGTYKKSAPDVGATIGAILGVLKKPLPINPVNVTKPAPKPGSC